MHTSEALRHDLPGRQGGHQLGEPDEIEDSPEIVGERGQAEFGANILQATHL